MCYSNFSRSFSRTKHSPGELLDLLDTDPPEHIGAPFRFGSMADRSSDAAAMASWSRTCIGEGQEQFVNLRPVVENCRYENNLHLFHLAVVDKPENFEATWGEKTILHNQFVHSSLQRPVAPHASLCHVHPVKVKTHGSNPTTLAWWWQQSWSVDSHVALKSIHMPDEVKPK